MYNQLPPQNTDAEQSLIAAILIDNSVIPDISDILSPDDFYSGKHIEIYKAIISLYNKKEPADLITVSEITKNPVYLAELINTIPMSTNAVYHANIIKEKSLRRAGITIAHEALKGLYGDDKYLDVVEKATAQLINIQMQKQDKNSQLIGEISSEAIDALELMQKQSTRITGIPSGIDCIDNILCGFQPSDLIILAGRPGMGKSALLGNIIENAPCSSAIFSLEMSKRQFFYRMISRRTRITGSRFRTGGFNQTEWNLIVTQCGELYEKQIIINDNSGMSIADIQRESRRLKKLYDIKLIGVDYLQLLKGAQRGNREQEISSISRGLKALAKDLDIPVIALSQLSRALESREDKRPILSDLRESGSLEQDADIVMFPYRECMYKKTDDFAENQKAEIAIAKHRNGATISHMPLRFIKELTWFLDVEENRIS